MLEGCKAEGMVGGGEENKRCFGTEMTKRVQIVLDGAKSLKGHFKALFPKAIFTLDVCHVVEKLWWLGRHFHKEGSDALKAWVEKLKTLLYAVRARTLVKRLQKMLRDTASRGPRTKSRRAALASLIGYLRPRISMMRYGVWIEQDLVIAP